MKATALGIFVVAVASCRGCDSGAVAGVDGGAPRNDGGNTDDAGENDAGLPFDAGPRDAGLVDGGNDSAPDAGDEPPFDSGIFSQDPIDAGDPAALAPASFSSTLYPSPFACEGDEDWCEPTPDLQRPWYDLLAIWSHTEGDDLVIDLLTHGLPFTCSGTIDIVVDVGRGGTLHACGNDLDCLNGDFVAVVDAVAIQNSQDVVYPPPQLKIFLEGSPPDLVLLGAGSVWMRADGFVTELRVPVDVSGLPLSEPRYFVAVNYPGDADFGDDVAPEPPPAALTSLGGRPDFLDPSEVFAPPTPTFTRANECANF